MTGYAPITLSSLDLPAGAAPAPGGRSFREAFTDRLREDFNFLPVPWLRAADDWASWGEHGRAVPGPRTAFGTTADRKGGRDLPLFWNELDLRAHRVMARTLCAENEFAIGFVSRLTDYHVRKGFGWQACLKGSKKGSYATSGAASDPAVVKGQNILDAWRDAAQWPLRSREAFRRWRRDGEVFGRFFRGGWGRLPQFRFPEPEQVGSPTGDTDGHASFGIETDPDDAETRHAYHLWRPDDSGEGDWVDADSILHVRANVDSTVKRGVPDFYPVYQKLTHVRELLDTILVTAIRQAAVAWREKFPSATGEQVRAIVPTGPAHAHPPDQMNLPWGYGPARGNRFPPGAVQRVEGNREFADGPTAGGVGNFLEAEQAAIRACCVRWGMPEYTGSADASNNNFASSLVAGSPFAVAVEGSQYEWGALWERPVALKVLDLAVEAGLLTAAERARLDVEVTEPAVVTPKPQEETTRNETLLRNKVICRDTWRQREGVDPHHEEEGVQKDAAADAKSQPPAGPADAPPGDPGGGGDVFGEGTEWMSEGMYTLLTEAGREGLVQKEITDKLGRKRKVWVRAEQPKAKEKPRAKEPDKKADDGPIRLDKPDAGAGLPKHEPGMIARLKAAFADKQLPQLTSFVWGQARSGTAAHAALRQWAAGVKDPSGSAARALGTTFSVPVHDGDTVASVVDRGLRREAFLADKPGPGESKEAFVGRHYPELKGVTGLRLEGVSTPQARVAVHDLYEMRDHASVLSKKGVAFHISDAAGTPDIDHMGHLKGVKPRGWPEGKTWDDAPGCYSSATKRVISGSGSHGAVSLLAHEAGHAVGDVLGLDNDPETIGWHEKLHAKLPAYLQQDGPGGFAGRQEMIAETVGIYVRRGKAGVAAFQGIGPEYADWLDKKMKGMIPAKTATPEPKADATPKAEPKKPAADTPHGKARAALDALGLAHDHLSDAQAAGLHDQILKLHAKATPKPKAAAKKPAKGPTPAAEKAVATLKDLHAGATDTTVSNDDLRAKATAAVSGLTLADMQHAHAAMGGASKPTTKAAAVKALVTHVMARRASFVRADA